MTDQLSMMDILTPPDPLPVLWCDLPRRTVSARARGGQKTFAVVGEDPHPFEIEVRGITCTISYSLGFSTWAVDGPGTPFWSESGFRSFGLTLYEPAEIAAVIERFIDRPAKDGNGLGGQLLRWWPHYATQWRDGLRFMLEHGRDRSTLWAQWGPDRQAEIWAAKEVEFDAALHRMQADGIDPNDVCQQRPIKGRWPTITHDTRLTDIIPETI